MPSAGSVSTLLLRPVLGALFARGIAPAGFFAATDLTPEIVADGDARVSPAQFCVAWAELVRQTEPTIALAIAEGTPPGAFGIVEYVCRSAPTLGDALRRWVRYLNLLDDAVEVGLVEDGDRTCLRVLTESQAPAPASHELCFALVVAQARALSRAPFRAVGVDFTHRAPADVARYRAWFDAPVAFGAPHTQLVLSRAAMDGALVSADPGLSAILSRVADEQAAKKKPSALMTDQVERILRGALRDDDGHVEVVAKRLGLTARSLQRRLRDEGTSFQAVREDVRRALAARYLEDDLSIAEISFLLGFSEPSAFFRAWKRWTGLTPAESRERARGAPA